MRKNAFCCCKYPNVGFRVSPSTAIKPKKNGTNTMNQISEIKNATAIVTAFWDDEAGITFGAYVIKSNGWWSEDGNGWYGVESDEEFESTNIFFIGGPLDGSYSK
jgi:hypothetical protein